MKRILTYIFLISMLPLAGCKKFLEKPPDNRTEVTAPDQVTLLLTTAYPHANYILFCEAMSDNAEDKGGGGAGDPSDLINRQSYMFQDVQSKELDSPEAYWDSCYKAIAVANQALQIINDATDQNSFKAQRGEALVARAYAHFMLVTLFAKAYDPATASSDQGIPYVTTPETQVFAKYDRKTVAYVYDMIEKDLLDGIPLIDERIYGNAPKFHFTKRAAHAFASRFYLFKRNYPQVIAHAEQAFSGSAAENLRFWNTSYSDLQYFDLQAIYTKSSERANILLQEANSIWGRSYPLYRFGLGSDLLNELFLSQNVTGGAYAIRYNIYGSVQYYNIPKFYEHFVRAGINADIGDPYNTIPLLTAEEVLFNRSEAYARLKNYPAALADLNAWISKNIRAYNSAQHDLTAKKVVDYYKMPTDTMGALVRAGLDFKRVSFMHEGLRWFDILRLKIPIVHTTDDGLRIPLSANDFRRVLQIPQEASLSGIPLNPR
ncbi:RagB/SusD family nutrient uptake outer membrane protein [Chitinophagaceae bacterium LB-8]|uniref:RagB/SusD family nutrient uptake outer membrane protein n=1 Tax=Paraflavisolibacter caeni TaxID=2982496 RepID=A0A9X2XSP9_9BACT|nr:RagB/SusD family nutrient uptake outer membrane protein [Paraflavisolibacter caeni]MCU7547632.1 RagB/SusD family nutrient uptake outer membrane protein [Paraflavisolibacter caeni]